jgi:hypothetical protein
LHTRSNFNSELYRLDREDFAGRRGRAGAQPVENVENTMDDWFAGKWVAEVSARV